MRSPLVSIPVWGKLLPLLALDCVLSKWFNSFAGPYITFLHKWDACPSDKTTELLIRPSHFSRSRPYDLQTLSGNLSFNEQVTDNIWTEIDLAVWANNQWKENAFKFPFVNTGCSQLLEIPDFFRLLVKYAGASSDPCVIPVGQSVMKNEPVNWTFPHFPVMPYGRYRYRVRSRKSRDSPIIRMCVETDCEVIPKP